MGGYPLTFLRDLGKVVEQTFKLMSYRCSSSSLLLIVSKETEIITKNIIILTNKASSAREDNFIPTHQFMLIDG